MNCGQLGEREIRMNNTWVITIDGIDYEEGTPEYWEAIRSKENEKSF